MEINALSQKFTTTKLLKFALPSIMMMFVLSTYTAIDGIFISTYIGGNGIGALNVVMPMITGTIAITLMLSTGANSLLGRYMGENKYKKANGLLSAIYIIGISLGIVIFLLSFLFKENILNFLGTSESLYEMVDQYFSIIIFFLPALFLQAFGQNFFIIAGHPKFSMYFTILGGVVNASLDYLFIVKLEMGMSGAALATGIGYLIPAIAAIIFFFFNKKGTLFFEKPIFHMKEIFNLCYNGSSELIGNISGAIVTILFNISLLKLIGDTGTTAIGIIFQIHFILASIYYGFCFGVAPIISYKFGEGKMNEVKSIVKSSFKFLTITGILIIVIGLLFSTKILSVYNASPEVFALTKQCFVIYIFTFLPMGFTVFLAALFTALGNGKISAIIAFLRTFVFLISTIIILPKLFGIYGVWFSSPVAEIMAVIIGIIIYKINIKKYYKKEKHD